MQHPTSDRPIQKPLYIDFLAEALEHMLTFRNGAEYAMQNGSYIAQRRAEKKRRNTAGEKRLVAPLDVANGSLIKGNLAKIVLTHDDKSWGVDWIAPSFQMRKSVLKSCTSERSQIVLTADDGFIRVHANQSIDRSSSGGEEWNDETWSDSFQPELKADFEQDNDRTHDSEHLLLNYLDYLIRNGTIKRTCDANGFLSIVSERIPCPSCTRNIREFLRRHTWINFRLFYLHDTTDRGPQQFLDDCTDHQISAIEKIALQTVVHLVRVEGNPQVVLSERVVEQNKMFGGAPNQIISSINSGNF